MLGEIPPCCYGNLGQIWHPVGKPTICVLYGTFEMIPLMQKLSTVLQFCNESCCFLQFSCIQWLMWWVMCIQSQVISSLQYRSMCSNTHSLNTLCVVRFQSEDYVLVDIERCCRDEIAGLWMHHKEVIKGNQCSFSHHFNTTVKQLIFAGDFTRQQIC